MAAILTWRTDAMKDLSCFAHIFRAARKARGESQRDVARRLGVSQQWVSRLERGRVGLEQASEICKAYGLGLEIRLGDAVRTAVYPIDPAERREIEANLDWFSRLPPARRLRTIEQHVRAARRLQGAADDGR